MIALLQRVIRASVVVDASCVGSIQAGALALVGIQKGDDEAVADRLIERMLGYRMFPDARGRMNACLRDMAGGLLLVPQFTLAADTRKGARPSFTPAAPPDEAERLFGYVVQQARASYRQVASGRFGAHMEVSLVNDGPVTFWLEVPPEGP